MKVQTAIPQISIPPKKSKKVDRNKLSVLLRDGNLTFTEIGKRFGVSRERIRQLAMVLGEHTGRERQVLRSVNPRQVSWEELPFVKACKAQNLAITPVSNFNRRMFFVEGKSCAVSSASYSFRSSIIKRLNCQHKYWVINRSRIDVDIYVFDLHNGNWVILPNGFAPAMQTCFALDRIGETTESTAYRGGTYSHSHHYREFLNAWEVFRGEKT